MAPPILAILFDLDNTLIATRKADTLACNKLIDILCEKYGVAHEQAKSMCGAYLRAFRKSPAHTKMDLDTWRCYLWSQALGEHCELTEQIYKIWLDLRYDCLAITPEIEALLRNLRTHYFVGLITNGPSTAQWEKVERLNLKTYFDIILVSGDWPWEKPHHKIFHEACDYLGIEPHQCIMVGDKLDTDILGGNRAKLGGTVWVPLANRDIGQSEACPDYIIDVVTELPGLLPQIKRVPPRFRSRLAKRTFCLEDMEEGNSNSSDGS